MTLVELLKELERLRKENEELRARLAEYEPKKWKLLCYGCKEYHETILCPRCDDVSVRVRCVI